MADAMRLDNFDGNISYGEDFVIGYATEAITLNNWVAFVAGNTDNAGGDPYFSVQTADSADADGREGICGVAVETTSAAGPIRIQIAGRRTGVNVAATVVAGENLVASTTAGRAQDANQVTDDADQLEYRIAAVAITTASSNTSTVDIYRHPRWGQT